MHHFHRMMRMAGPDCRSWRGISWQSLALRACGQTKLHAKMARLRQGRTSLETQRYFPTELELISTDCVGKANVCMGAAEPKASRGLAGLISTWSGLSCTTQVIQVFVSHSLYPSYAGSVNAKDIPASRRSLCFLCSSRWWPMRVPERGFISTGRPLHHRC